MHSRESSSPSFHHFRQLIHTLQVRDGSQDKFNIQRSTMCYPRSQDMRKIIQYNTQVHGSVLMSCLLHNITRACSSLSRRFKLRGDLRHICLIARLRYLPSQCINLPGEELYRRGVNLVLRFLLPP
jgi:hypothetical protein